MAIKTLFVNTIGRTKAADKITQEDGVIRAKTPKPDSKPNDAWRLYFELESTEQVQRLHSRLAPPEEDRPEESVPEGMEGNYDG